MQHPSVVVLGGYGVFGSRITASLVRHAGIEVTIAGRDGARASALAAAFAPRAVRPLALDITQPAQVDAVLAARPAILIDTVGPFQARDFGLARRCIDAGVHYLDIADGRERVAAVDSLDGDARAAGVLIVSGASTVPAVSTAIVSDLAPEPGELLEIDVGISPGHSAPRGLATARAILGYCGKSIPALAGDAVEYGWGDLGRHRYPPPVGQRLLANVDTPERELWRRRHPALRRGSIRAGLEIGALHLSLSLLSRAVRAGLLDSLVPQAARFIRVADACDRFGSDVGAMHVRIVVRGRDGAELVRQSTLVAEQGDGPQIPAAPAALIAKRLLALPGYRPLDQRGARACVDLFSIGELMTELDRYAIRHLVER